MKKIICLLIGVAALLSRLTLSAQIKNEGLAQGILAARQKDATLLKQYNWNSRVEVQHDEKTADIRLYLVSYGPDGELQRSLINDDPAKVPGGFFRRAVAEDKKKEMEKLIHHVGKLVDQYTLPTAGKVIDFISQAQISPLTSPEGKTILQLNGNNVVVPGDSFAMTVDGTTLRPISLQITTTYEDSQVTVSATFHTGAAGLNHLQFATVLLPDKGLTINIHNYDYVPQN